MRMKNKRRVVISGMGIISPIGNSIEEFSSNLNGGVCGISELEKGDTLDFKGIEVKVAAQVKNFVPSQYGLTTQDTRRSDRYSQYALAAAIQAMSMSGLESGINIDPEMLGVYVSSGIGGIETFVNQSRNMLENGGGFVSPLFIPTMIANIGGANIAIKFNAQGPALTTVSACASSTNAVGEAFYAIQRGDADAILAGGSEAAICPIALGGFQNARALSMSANPRKACTPFDENRSGFVMGEGAGILVLEEYEHAVSRGATIYAEICGYGNTCDAHHVTAPSPDGLPAAKAMRKALKEGGYRDELLYINAHGTGTHLNDACETKAIKLALGEELARKAMISSTKSMTGHMLGAAGAVEAIASVLALKNGIVPPTIGYSSPDPDCDLDYTPNKARKADIQYAMSNSLGFGGHNVCILLKKSDK